MYDLHFLTYLERSVDILSVYENVSDMPTSATGGQNGGRVQLLPTSVSNEGSLVISPLMLGSCFFL